MYSWQVWKSLLWQLLPAFVSTVPVTSIQSQNQPNAASVSVTSTRPVVSQFTALPAQRNRILYQPNHLPYHPTQVLHQDLPYLHLHRNERGPRPVALSPHLLHLILAQLVHPDQLLNTQENQINNNAFQSVIPNLLLNLIPLLFK